MFEITRATIMRALTSFKTDDIVAAPELDGGSLRLFTAVAEPISELSVAADFTVPTWTGYANKTIAAWGANYVGPLNEPQSDAPIQQWNGPADATGQEVLGWFYLNAAGLLVAAGTFDEGPQPMLTVDDAIVLSLTSRGARGGDATVLSAL